MRSGYATLTAKDFGALAADPQMAAYHACWGQLPMDDEMPAGATYRRRRFGRLKVTVTDSVMTMEALPHAAFTQAAEIIALHQGKARLFEPIPREVLLGPVMRALVAFDVAAAHAVSGSTRWLVNLHMVRVVARSGLDGQPTPEGRHRDGHLFVGMHLLGRTGCGGGESVVYVDDRPVMKTTMCDQLDSLIVDDQRVTHEVTAITSTGAEGIRDMLLVDLNLDPNGA
ncbi:MAG TPA: 2OG-Fe dioxygenase family protein [Candidatus Limnocylindrales bacterium]|nr:2OG-Fe dioxygenase family protein [Candidatus Limnocylindrales bacterium]